MFSLETPRLILRDLQLMDVPSFYELGSDPEVTRYQDTIWVDSEPAALEWVQRAVARNQEHPRTGYHLAILRKQDGAWLGYFGFGKAGDLAIADIEFGYALHKKFWGQGYASEALQAVLSFCFADPGVTKIFGECDQANPASARVMEKAGLHLAHSYLEWNEKTRQADCIQRFLISRPEWEAAQHPP